MPNDTAVVRLLYAIISQKSMKDVDWDKVAEDPVLCQEITNGHAARMRYSRFKKQMEGTSSSTASKPRKSRISKTPSFKSSSSSNAKHEKRDPDRAKAKAEHDERGEGQGNIYGGSFTSNGSGSSARHMQTPDPEPGMSPLMADFAGRMKPEPGSSRHSGAHGQNNPNAYIPTTPLTSICTPTHYSRYAHGGSASPSPNVSFENLHHGLDLGPSGINPIYTSFDSHHSGMGLSQTMMSDDAALFDEYSEGYPTASQHVQRSMSMEYQPGLWVEQPESEEALESGRDDNKVRGGINVKNERWEVSFLDS